MSQQEPLQPIAPNVDARLVAERPDSGSTMVSKNRLVGLRARVKAQTPSTHTIPMILVGLSNHEFTDSKLQSVYYERADTVIFFTTWITLNICES